MSWLAYTTLQSITLVRGFDTGVSTVFLSWLGFFASPALSISCKSTNLLPRGHLWCQGKPLEDMVVARDRLVLGPRPPLRSLLWLKL
jgi:hypothetical protein